MCWPSHSYQTCCRPCKDHQNHGCTHGGNPRYTGKGLLLLHGLNQTRPRHREAEPAAEGVFIVFWWYAVVRIYAELYGNVWRFPPENRRESRSAHRLSENCSRFSGFFVRILYGFVRECLQYLPCLSGVFNPSYPEYPATYPASLP